MESSFTVEVDNLDQNAWHAATQKFADMNLFQTWAYGLAKGNRQRVSHLLLRDQGEPAAAVQVRLIGLRQPPFGVAYARWGPLWKSRGQEASERVFRHAVRALRDEYVTRRGLVVRLIPGICAAANEPYSQILSEEGFIWKGAQHPYRTILMDVRPSLEELENGFHQKWRKHLKRARTNNLEILEGEDDALFQALESVHKEMVARKRFSGAQNMGVYQRAQQLLAPDQKLKVVLCRVKGEIVAGALFSTMGDTALDLYRATSNAGVATYGSYLVQWHVLQRIREAGCKWYNLNGINPVRNPGGYQFKSQLAGKHGLDVQFVGTFDLYPNRVMRLICDLGDQARAWKTGKRTPAAKVPESQNAV